MGLLNFFRYKRVETDLLHAGHKLADEALSIFTTARDKLSLALLHHQAVIEEESAKIEDAKARIDEATQAQATTAYVANAISNLVGDGPTTS